MVVPCCVEMPRWSFLTVLRCPDGLFLAVLRDGTLMMVPRGVERRDPDDGSSWRRETGP